MTEVNFNDPVWVRLTREGQSVLKDWRRKYKSRSGMPKVVRRKDSRGKVWTSFQLWEMMNIFGVYMSHGGPNLFKDNVLRFAIPE